MSKSDCAGNMFQKACPLSQPRKSRNGSKERHSIGGVGSRGASPPADQAEASHVPQVLGTESRLEARPGLVVLVAVVELTLPIRPVAKILSVSMASVSYCASRLATRSSGHRSLIMVIHKEHFLVQFAKSTSKNDGPACWASLEAVVLAVTKIVRPANITPCTSIQVIGTLVLRKTPSKLSM